MLINGIDTDALGDDYSSPMPGTGRTLLIDGDGPAYVAAATVKTVATGLRKFQSQILEQIFLAGCSDGEVFLTHEECTKAGRFTIKGFKPYQGQRKGGEKPALLSQVREIAEQEGAMNEFTVQMEHIVEADDAMMMRSYTLKEGGVIRSDDKDLRMTPWAYYEIKQGCVLPPDPFGYLWIEETATQKKCVGRSLKFFWAQMMMGDSADNVRGLDKYNGKNIGPVDTFKVLDPIGDIEALCNTVIGAYRAIDQNPLPEGWMLWMLRHPADNVWAYFQELPWSKENEAFLADCVGRDWFIK